MGRPPKLYSFYVTDENAELRPCTMVKNSKALQKRQAAEKAKKPGELREKIIFDIM